MGWVDANSIDLKGGKFVDMNSVVLEPPPPSAMEYLSEQAKNAAGNFARGGLQGIAGIADIPEVAYNLTQQGLESLTDTPPRNSFPFRMPLPATAAANAAADAMHIPSGEPDFQRLGAGITGGALAGPVGALSGGTGALTGVAAEHAGAGPVGQFAASLAGGMIPALGESAYQALQARPTAQQLMAAHLNSRPDMQSVVADTQNNLMQANRAGIPNTLAEASLDPNLMRMQAILSGEPETMGKMAQFAQGRDNIVAQRLYDLAHDFELPEGMQSPQSSQEAANFLTQAAEEKAREITKDLSAQAEPLYSEAFTKKLAPNNPILSDPIVQHYIGEARRDISFSPQTTGFPDNSISVLDAAKRKMQQAIDTKYDVAAPANTGAIKAAQGNLISAIDTQLNNSAGTNVYKQARAIYSGQSDKLALRARLGQLSELDTTNPATVARSIASGGTDATKAMAEALGRQSPVAGQSLIYNALENSAETNAKNIPGAYGVPGKIYASPAQIARMNMLVGAENAGEVQDVMESVQRANQSNAYRAGSQTNPLEQAGENMRTAAPAKNWFKSAVSFAHGDYINGIGGLMAKVQSGKGYDPEVLRGLQEILTTQKGRELLDALKRNPDAFAMPGFRARLMQELAPQAKALAYVSALNAQRE